MANLVARFDKRNELCEVEAYLFDQTARKQAEQSLRAANERNERNAAQLQSVFRQMTEGLIVLDPAGNLIEANPAALVMHGLRQKGSLPRILSEMSEVFKL